MALQSLACALVALSVVAASPLQKTGGHGEHEFAKDSSGSRGELEHEDFSEGSANGQFPVVDFSFFLNSENGNNDDILISDVWSGNTDIGQLEVNINENDRIEEDLIDISSNLAESVSQFSTEGFSDDNMEERTFLGTMKHNSELNQVTEPTMYGTETVTDPTNSMSSSTETTSTSYSSEVTTTPTTTTTTTLSEFSPSTERETTSLPTQQPATSSPKTTTLDPINVNPLENFVEFERLFQRRLWKQAEFDSDDIVDVVTNFIYKRNPLLQLLLSICFVHPKCYTLEDVYMSNVVNNQDTPVSEIGASVEKLLREKRREAARNIIIDLLLQIQVDIKEKMFHYFTTEVARRGRTVETTKIIIDSVKVIWEKTNDDLESAKVSIRELFYLLPLESDSEISAIVQMSEAAQNITEFVDAQYKAAIQDKTNNKRQSRNFGVWDNIFNF